MIFSNKNFIRISSFQQKNKEKKKVPSLFESYASLENVLEADNREVC